MCGPNRFFFFFFLIISGWRIRTTSEIWAAFSGHLQKCNLVLQTLQQKRPSAEEASRIWGTTSPPPSSSLPPFFPSPPHPFYSHMHHSLTCTTHHRATTNLPSSHYKWPKNRSLEGWGGSNSWNRGHEASPLCVRLQHDTQQWVRSWVD